MRTQEPLRTSQVLKAADASLAGAAAREKLLAWMPVTERRMTLAGVSTAVLEGGDGPPVVLLHGPGAYAAHWMRVIPALVAGSRVIAPDLPGHGASNIREGVLDTARVLTWLRELIAETCKSPPVLVGQLVAGAIAARFAAEQRNDLRGLVLVDSLGLAPFEPAPEFAQALSKFFTQPAADTHEGLWRYCAHDLQTLRTRMGQRWEQFEAYNVDRARTPDAQAAVHSLMELFGFPAIPAADLAGIVTPTTLVWGRHDLATRLSIAEHASERYGWPLHVIEHSADDPPIEQPEAFLRVLQIALSSARP
jgi:pimeloyl-ACP methyl ester carboxylesterase